MNESFKRSLLAFALLLFFFNFAFRDHGLGRLQVLNYSRIAARLRQTLRTRTLLLSLFDHLVQATDDALSEERLIFPQGSVATVQILAVTLIIVLCLAFQVLLFI